MRHLPPIEKS